jgi:CRISPR type III-B/RAMP module RAMP protein Cmr6
MSQWQQRGSEQQRSGQPGRQPQSPHGSSGSQGAKEESKTPLYPLPREAAKLVEQELARSGACANLGLQLHRYVPSAVLQFSLDYKKPSPGERQRWLQALVKGYQPDTAFATAVYQRWNALTRALNARHFAAEVDWRMVVGLGGNSVLETDLTLQRNYSLPIIPGRALKGLTRSYAAQENWEVSIPDEQGNLQQRKKAEDDLSRLFGTLDRAGSVIFFDAIPQDGQAKLAVDVMTPHYPDYYQKNRPPSNDQQPVPITFLTVTRTTFVFAIAPRTPDPGDRADAVLALALLKQALADYGVGGKTSAGYGYFHAPAAEASAGGSSSQAGQQSAQPTPQPEGIEQAQAKASELAALTSEQLVRKDAHELFKALRDLPSPAAQRLLARAIVNTYRQKGVDLRKKSQLKAYIDQILNERRDSR